MVEFGTAQRLVWENKLAKGLGTTDVPLEFCLAKNAARRYRALPGGAFVKEEPD